MLFSYGWVVRICEACDFRFERAYTSSILLIVALAGIGTGLWAGWLDGRLGLRWWMTLGLLVGNAVLAVLALSAPDLVRDWISPVPNKCPECHSELSTGSGFGHGARPGFQDWIAPLLFVPLTIVMIAAASAVFS